MQRLRVTRPILGPILGPKMKLLVAAALACAAAHPAHAEPQPAEGCKRAAAFRVVVDVDRKSTRLNSSHT